MSEENTKEIKKGPNWCGTKDPRFENTQCDKPQGTHCEKGEFWCQINLEDYKMPEELADYNY
ncbi:MAG: hypothetical protein J0G32_05800 [Alphaproteobacteria bacterium]|nr:hypothetical protein [Alphaproteobacteria bacterium]OJV16032.1 MAG: hypothetical protein BGO27_04205 [Alphaproteobacteria bacterium 33-17]